MWQTVLLEGIREATVQSSHRSRRFWIRMRNRCLPWFMWSY